MSHDTHHDAHGADSEQNLAKMQYWSGIAFSLVVILLFICTANFVEVMSKPAEGHGAHASGHSTEAAHQHPSTDAPAHQHDAAPASSTHESH